MHIDIHKIILSQNHLVFFIIYSIYFHLMIYLFNKTYFDSHLFISSFLKLKKNLYLNWYYFEVIFCIQNGDILFQTFVLKLVYIKIPNLKKCYICFKSYVFIYVHKIFQLPSNRYEVRALIYFNRKNFRHYYINKHGRYKILKCK